MLLPCVRNRGQGTRGRGRQCVGSVLVPVADRRCPGFVLALGGSRMVRFSYGLAPGYPAGEALELVKAAEGFGFYGCYLGDDVTLRDTWVIAGAAARETGTIRIGFSATHAYLREPSLIAQGLATLDELSGGRVEAAIGLGGLDTLDRHHVVWRGSVPWHG
jgi:5,10-methylenetetrahydromethanopterin reductase